MQCSAVQFSAVQCREVLWSAVQGSAVHWYCDIVIFLADNLTKCASLVCCVFKLWLVTAVLSSTTLVSPLSILSYSSSLPTYNLFCYTRRGGNEKCWRVSLHWTCIAMYWVPLNYTTVHGNTLHLNALIKMYFTLENSAWLRNTAVHFIALHYNKIVAIP